jgi:hypothetical protein
MRHYLNLKIIYQIYHPFGVLFPRWLYFYNIIIPSGLKTVSKKSRRDEMIIKNKINIKKSRRDDNIIETMFDNQQPIPKG